MPRGTNQQNSGQIEKNQHIWTRQLLARIRSLTTTVVIYGSIVIFLVGVILISISYAPFFTSSSDLFTGLLRGIGEGLVTGIIITGLASFLVTRYPEKVQGDIDKFFTQEVQNKMTALQKDITTQTKGLTTLQKDVTTQTKGLTTFQKDVMAQMKQLIAIPHSMKVLDDKGISRVYESRSEAVEDMVLDLRDQVTHIRIMGISLSSLIRYRDAPLYKVWDEITKYVKSNVDQAHPRSSRLEIKVLLIDPECLGAQLRSWWESEHPQHPVRVDAKLKPISSLSPLKSDVLQTAHALQNFMKTIPTSPDAGISFEVRLYRLPPQLFLLSTDKVSYVMPYYFWRGAEDMPLFKLANIESQLSQGMYDHFDLIWQKASISLEQFLEEHHVGLDKGMYECGAINVYDTLEKARKRMLHLLGNAKERVCIQGVSLNSTLGGSQQDDLVPVIADLVGRGIEVKILMLDPESEQAKFRAFREWSLQEHQPDITFEQYQKQASEKLYWDTNATIDRLATLQHDLLHQNVKIDTFSTMKYDAAPCCFMFLVDNTVLVEQYSYGIVVTGKIIPTILGGEMPLVEYVGQPGDLYETRQDKRVFEMMKDHFNFVFDHYAHPIDRLVTAPDNVTQPSSA
jgi:hypothetical protein